MKIVYTTCMRKSKGVYSMAFDLNLFETNFTFAFKAVAANNIRVATKAFDEFWKSNSQFLSEAEDLYGRILSYAVNQQFKNSAPITASAYIVSGQEVNVYKAKAVFLNTSDYITSICRTDKPLKLPCRARYKLKLALGNRGDDQQIELFPDQKNKELAPDIPKKYAIIGYRYINGEMKHLNIIVPDWEYKSILHSENLLNQINEFYNYIPEEIVEENVAKLKDNIAQEVKTKNII